MHYLLEDLLEDVSLVVPEQNVLRSDVGLAWQITEVIICPLLVLGLHLVNILLPFQFQILNLEGEFPFGSTFVHTHVESVIFFGYLMSIYTLFDDSRPKADALLDLGG